MFDMPMGSNDLNYYGDGAELGMYPSYGSDKYPVYATSQSTMTPEFYSTRSLPFQPLPDPGIDWDEPVSSPSDISFLLPRQKRGLPAASTANSDDVEAEEDLANFASMEFAIDPSFTNISDYLSRSANHTFMSENLMQIYHDSMENALSCWLNERTCPYRFKTSTPKAITNGPPINSDGEDVKQAWRTDWPNRIFRRVVDLDRVAGRIRDKPLSHSEDNAASKALYLVIMAFATQWAQASKRSREEHPPMNGAVFPGQTQNGNGIGNEDVEEFDRVIQQAYWASARKALLECADIESFKVAFANIIFSLTQRPIAPEHQAAIRRDSQSSNNSSLPANLFDFDLSTLQDRVDKVIDEDGPPIYLEQGVRHVHSLRHKLQRRERELAKANPGMDPKKTVLKEEERATVELMAWLGYMLESLTSAMHQRPLVVADEDCDVLPEAIEALNLKDDEIPVRRGSETKNSSRLWDDYFFLQDQSNRRGEILRYPCSYSAAAAGLTDAAPIKVLLYRKVTLLQTLFTRGTNTAKIEDTINDAMKTYEYWQSRYEPFFQDCIANHDKLHQRIQSWYICLCAHWHLATLLLADAIEAIDGAELSSDSGRRVRRIGNLVGTLQRHNSHLVSDLARCATPRADASFPTGKGWHFALNSGALLTEPWTAILIRVFSKAAVLLMREAWGSSRTSSPNGGSRNGTSKRPNPELLKRCEDSIRALKYLGRKSDTARLAGDTLSDALAQKFMSQRARHQYQSTHGYVPTMGATTWGEHDLGIAATGQASWLSQGDVALEDVGLFGPDGNINDDGFGLDNWA
jgi:hypothetical protein